MCPQIVKVHQRLQEIKCIQRSKDAGAVSPKPNGLGVGGCTEFEIIMRRRKQRSKNCHSG